MTRITVCDICGAKSNEFGVRNGKLITDAIIKRGIHFIGDGGNYNMYFIDVCFECEKIVDKPIADYDDVTIDNHFVFIN